MVQCNRLFYRGMSNQILLYHSSKMKQLSSLLKMMVNMATVSKWKTMTFLTMLYFDNEFGHNKIINTL